MNRNIPDPESEISALLRANIRNIVPYSTARDDCQARMDICLDANENPFDSGVNRYPSPHQPQLKRMLSAIRKVPASNIFLGNGSDEPIDLVFRLFCPPGNSSMVQAVPTYGMYSVAAAINDVDVIDAPLSADFSLDADDLLSRVRPDTRLIFLCSPNNPSGNLLDRDAIISILDRFQGIVVVDEAYIDFAENPGFTGLLSQYPRLIVLQTLSKAWGMAGLRIGMAMADSCITGIMSRIKYPYNISVLNQSKAEEILSDPLKAADRVKELIAERARLSEALSALPEVLKVYPSDANFLLVRFLDKDKAFAALMEAGIIVRDRSSAYNCAGCLRITVGTPEENDRLLAVLARLGMNIGFGEKTVSKVCEETGIDTVAFILICNMYSYQGYMPTEETLESADPESVLKYLHNSHSFYMEEDFRKLEKVMNELVAPCSPGQKKVILDFLEGYKTEVERHFEYEEQVFFPYVRAVMSGTACGDYSASKFEENHSNIEEKLNDLKNIVMKYLPHECSPRLASDVLFALFSLSEDLGKHTGIEDLVLVPMTNRMEKKEA